MQIIPAIDVMDGAVVRLCQGDFRRVTRYGDDPRRYASDYAVSNVTALHLVNLSGAKNQDIDPTFLALVHDIARSTTMHISVGGGIRSLRDIRAVLEAGAEQVVIGTMLFRNPADVSAAVHLFGSNRVIAALDVFDDEVKVQGWRLSSGFDLRSACQLVEEVGVSNILVTDIVRDGMAQGPNTRLYRKLVRQYPSLRIIASGGMRSYEDVRALERTNVDAVVIGKALLDGSLPRSVLSRQTIAPKRQRQKQEVQSTLAIRVIPCLDVKNDRVVKGTSFQNLRDAGDPVVLAKRYCEEGADELVFLDIAASAENRDTAYALVERVADAVNIPFTIGGGIRSVEDARRILMAGADKVSVNSAAVHNPSLLSAMANELGSANTMCAIDARKKGKSWTVLVRGGRDDANIDAIAWAEEAVKRGAGELLVTSFDRDGTGDGFDVELLSHIKQRVSVPVIASGGAGSLDSFIQAIARGKSDAVLAASVFHFGKFSIRDVKKSLQSASFPVRL